MHGLALQGAKTREEEARKKKKKNKQQCKAIIRVMYKRPLEVVPTNKI
jgi:hypothetical protein